MTHHKLRKLGGQAGYAALFAILLITAIFTISLINANLSVWQSQSHLINRNNSNRQARTAAFCEQVATANSLGEIDFCLPVNN